MRTEFGFGQQEEVWSWENSALQAGRETEVSWLLQGLCMALQVT